MLLRFFSPASRVPASRKRSIRSMGRPRWFQANDSVPPPLHPMSARPEAHTELVDNALTGAGAFRDA